MVRQVRQGPGDRGQGSVPPSWKATLAIAVSVGALVWHLLACVEGPMAYSPDGKHLVFVARDPIPDKLTEEEPLAGKQTFRLFVLTDQKDLRLVEETKDHLLAAPAVSPDGKRIAYLRVKLPSAAPTTQGAATAPADDEWPIAADMVLPSLRSTRRTIEKIKAGTSLLAELVLRDLANNQQLEVRKLCLPEPRLKGDSFTAILAIAGRLTFAPDGKRLYLSDGYFAWSIDLAEKDTQKMLMVNVCGASLSPDGQWLAGINDDIIIFARTDGSRTIYQRMKDVNGLWPEWIGNDSVLCRSESQLLAVSLAGEIRDLGKIEKVKDALNLSLSPDGRRIAVAGKPGSLLDFEDGKATHLVDVETLGVIDTPTWRPDSKAFAARQVEQIGKSKLRRTTHILFFDRDGRQTDKVAVPEVNPVKEKVTTEHTE